MSLVSSSTQTRSSRLERWWTLQEPALERASRVSFHH